MGIRSRMVAAFGALLLASLLLFGVGSYRLLLLKGGAQQVEYQQRAVAAVQAGVVAELSRLQLEVRELAGAVAGRLADSRQADARVLAALADFQGVHPEVMSVVWVAAGDRPWLHFPVSRALDRRALTGSIEGHQVDAGPILLAGEHPLLRFLVPVPHSGMPAAASHVVVDTDFSRLQSLLRSQDAPSYQMFIAGQDGALLTSSGEPLFAVLPADALPGGASATGGVGLEVDGHQYDLSLQPLAAGLWLGVLTDKALLRQQVMSAVQQLLVLAAVILALFGALLLFLIYHRLQWLLDRLLSYCREVLRGSRSAQLQLDDTGGVGKLALAVGEMGMRLQGADQHAARLAYYDQLTDLPNRSSLKESLTRLLEVMGRSGQKLAVLFVDLDDFKKVNDRLGHDAGDELLVQVSQRLKQALRKGDLLGGNLSEEAEAHLLSRRGGDEFNAVLPAIKGPRDAAMVAERLITDISVPLMIAGSQVSVGASVGIALFPDDGADAETLLRHADMAMYQAKAQGKNKYYLFTESINAEVRRRLEMEQAVAIGLQRNEFELYYQPKLNLRTMEVTGFEALMRWITPDRGVVSPAEFVPLTEASQLIHDLGNWVIAEAMHQMAQWDDILPPGLRVAINISPRQIVEDNFAGQFISLAEQFGVSPARLEVELTETSVLTDEALVHEHLQTLRAAGVKVSLDDFGTGYSSLTFLRNLPIDAVKIDRSFVSRLNQEGGSQEIVISVLELCHKLRLETIAEGVENADQMVTLLNNGCTEAQGYLFAPALPADDVLAYLSERVLPGG
ncbi:bifunctional diguanylate cyclase/phosphodiesterase [Pseudomaricurvus sp. HS19]|uniref:putative bifunctional diguanylate cyclase/phosphodiesterase n=1 Tax=Pseudomaricurvus sp. HS19 TaxID=2692626 RepID=UPI0013709A07|nr:EAL domain-containing protein [Pseudomaricurvus sp. HS19]MYM64124.1 EAL domain-containing protein [Pseudomaricurvus sp. HS19]